MDSVYYDISELENIDSIEILILSGADVSEIREVFPNFSIEKIEKIFAHVAKFLWLGSDEDEWEFYGLLERKKRAEQKPLTLRGWEYNQNGKTVDTILHESFMHFYLTSSSQKPHKNIEK